MKVFNLTDAATKAMKRSGMANNSIRVPGTDITVAPGTSENVPDKYRNVLQRWVNIDCLSINAVPKWYRGAARPKQAEPAPAQAPAGPTPDPKKVEESKTKAATSGGSEKKDPEVETVEVKEVSTSEEDKSSSSRRSSRRK